MEILSQNFALHAESVVKLAEQQVLIAVNASQLLGSLTIYIQVTVL